LQVTVFKCPAYFIFLLSRFFKGKVKSGFYCFFKWAFLKKTQVGFFGSFFLQQPWYIWTDAILQSSYQSNKGIHP